MISVYLYADLPAVVLKNNQIAEGFCSLLVLRRANGPADFLYMIDLPAEPDRQHIPFLEIIGNEIRLRNDIGEQILHQHKQELFLAAGVMFRLGKCRGELSADHFRPVVPEPGNGTGIKAFNAELDMVAVQKLNRFLRKLAF